ncbi:MAG: hypothetical protein R2939_05595 [Kofleriaceae bacterium]
MGDENAATCEPLPTSGPGAPSSTVSGMLVSTVQVMTVGADALPAGSIATTVTVCSPGPTSTSQVGPHGTAGWPSSEHVKVTPGSSLDKTNRGMVALSTIGGPITAGGGGGVRSSRHAWIGGVASGTPRASTAVITTTWGPSSTVASHGDAHGTGGASSRRQRNVASGQVAWNSKRASASRVCAAGAASSTVISSVPRASGAPAPGSHANPPATTIPLAASTRRMPQG